MLSCLSLKTQHFTIAQQLELSICVVITFIRVLVAFYEILYMC